MAPGILVSFSTFYHKYADNTDLHINSTMVFLPVTEWWTCNQEWMIKSQCQCPPSRSGLVSLELLIMVWEERSVKRAETLLQLSVLCSNSFLCAPSFVSWFSLIQDCFLFGHMFYLNQFPARSVLSFPVSNDKTLKISHWQRRPLAFWSTWCALSWTMNTSSLRDKAGNMLYFYRINGIILHKCFWAKSINSWMNWCVFFILSGQQSSSIVQNFKLYQVLANQAILVWGGFSTLWTVTEVTVMIKAVSKIKYFGYADLLGQSLNSQQCAYKKNDTPNVKCVIGWRRSHTLHPCWDNPSLTAPRPHE